jgi:hypothetical protein
LVFFSGAGPYYKGKLLYLGIWGESLVPDKGCGVVKYGALVFLRTLKDIIGDLDKVTQVVQVLGYVNVDSDYDVEKTGRFTSKPSI